MAILSTIKKVMPYLKTATGYVLCRLSSQAVEMDDGTTLQESYDSLNSKIPKVKIGSFTLSYYSAQWLRGEIDAGAEYNDRYPIVSMNYVEGTTSGTLKTEKVVNGKAVVWAQGNGYVPGHLISASFYIFDR